MPDISKECLNREHDFLGGSHGRNARRTHVVIGLTAVMMAGEITAGWVFGSMALLADGWHMASHAAALSITAVGYYLAKRHAADVRFSFGTGKFGDLAGFASALLLSLIALLMVYESTVRLVNPVPISFDEAMLVAFLGLLVNLASAWILRDAPHDHGHHHGHAHEHDHDHEHRPGAHGGHDTDNNLRSAYIHVIADALTSVLAILALAAGRWLGWNWMDPLMGIVGAVVITRWAWGLMKVTSRVLLDMTPDQDLAREVVRQVESDGHSRVVDFHLWRLGPGHFGAIVCLESTSPRSPEHYKRRLAHLEGLSHLTVEANPLEPRPDPERNPAKTLH